jgi:hypothetical protein
MQTLLRAMRLLHELRGLLLTSIQRWWPFESHLGPLFDELGDLVATQAQAQAAAGAQSASLANCLVL